MILDEETNFIYLSARIKTDTKYTWSWKSLQEALDRHHIPYGFIEGTRDIWCRDYMPIQNSESDFVQFTYFPDYLISPKYISTLTLPAEVVTTIDINRINTDLIIDGGNIVRSKSSIVVTDKVFKENKTLREGEVIAQLKQLLKVDNVYVIPKQPDDYTGHADGMVRFVDDYTLAVIDYSYQNAVWRKKMDAALIKTGLKIVSFPNYVSKERNADGDFTAIGNYINFARVGNKILFPLFGLAGERDIQAMEDTMALYPTCEIIPINGLDFAEEGGVLNCITWNIKRR